MRSYIRHPADIPINIDTPRRAQVEGASRLTNVSHGGLAFDSKEEIPAGKVIRIKISSVDPVFEAEGVVTHCSREAGLYVIGVEFIEPDDLFVARMVEQICHIEHYKREVEIREGRHLSGQEAAREWIDKYAAHFPQWS